MSTAVLTQVPERIETSCAMLNDAWNQFATMLTSDCRMCVQDDDRSLNWDAFLGRSVAFDHVPGFIDSGQGAADFSPLMERGIKLRDLAALWEIDALRDHFQHREETREPAAASCSMLLRSGGPAGELLCDAFQSLPKNSSHWSVRALLQNSAALSGCDFKFRRWLERELMALGADAFPPRNFRKMVTVSGPQGLSQQTLENAIRLVMGRVFHRANPVIASHMLCDWQLGLWLDGKTEVFDLFPYDALHKEFVASCPDLPDGEGEFVAWWHEQPGCAELPPRIAAMCMGCALRPSPQ